MKPMFKLLFALLLVGWALSVPKRARASGYTYCDSAVNACINNCTSNLGQCTYDCL